MHRTQIQLTNSQLQALRARAAEEHRSLADLIRESIDIYMTKAVAGRNRAELAARAKRAAGRYSSGGSDGSARHDAHLSEAFRS